MEKSQYGGKAKSCSMAIVIFRFIKHIQDWKWNETITAWLPCTNRSLWYYYRCQLNNFLQKYQLPYHGMFYNLQPSLPSSSFYRSFTSRSNLGLGFTCSRSCWMYHTDSGPRYGALRSSSLAIKSHSEPVYDLTIWPDSPCVHPTQTFPLQ